MTYRRVGREQRPWDSVEVGEGELDACVGEPQLVNVGGGVPRADVALARERGDSDGVFQLVLGEVVWDSSIHVSLWERHQSQNQLGSCETLIFPRTYEWLYNSITSRSESHLFLLKLATLWPRCACVYTDKNRVTSISWIGATEEKWGQNNLSTSANSKHILGVGAPVGAELQDDSSAKGTAQWQETRWLETRLKESAKSTYSSQHKLLMQSLLAWRGTVKAESILLTTPRSVGGMMPQYTGMKALQTHAWTDNETNINTWIVNSRKNTLAQSTPAPAPLCRWSAKPGRFPHLSLGWGRFPTARWLDGDSQLEGCGPSCDVRSSPG